MFLRSQAHWMRSPEDPNQREVHFLPTSAKQALKLIAVVVLATPPF